MGSITARKRKDGKTAYLAQIVIKAGGRIVHRENKTHSSKREAAGWIARREAEIEAEGHEKPEHGPTLAEVIEKYCTDNARPFGKTKAHVLATAKSMPIGGLQCGKIGSVEIVEFAKQIKARGVQPQTVQSYLSHLSGVFTIARPAWGYPLDEKAMADAQVVARKLGLASDSKERSRRPTLQELDVILNRFSQIHAYRPHTAPMVEIVLFALFSTRRQDEIARLAWADLDVEHSRVLVRDMKHPGDKIGNDTWCELVPEALAVALRQPRDGELIFPYTASAVSASFTRCAAFLGVEDLHFHDLRHEGTSRLFELGWTIPQVASVTGHRSWESLKRYTHIKQRGDKYDGWQWRPQAKKSPGRAGPRAAAAASQETTVQGVSAS